MEQLMTADQVARLLKTRVPRVYELARQRMIPTVHLGRNVRFDRRRLEEWIAQGGRALDGGGQDAA